MADLLRNIAFIIVFYGGSIPIVVFAPLAALFGSRTIQVYCAGWIGFGVWCARHILRIRIRVEGQPTDVPAIYAAKHQSMFETMALVHMLDIPAVVMKQELASIPLWGWAARRYGNITVDRDASATALRRMMREAGEAVTAGRSILIFPEGTRVLPGETPPLRSGFAGLYRMLKLPVVPVALDSGHLWPRKGLKRSGIVTIRFEPVVPVGLPRQEAEQIVHRGINALETNSIR